MATKIIYPTEDSWVRKSVPDNNYGNDTALMLQLAADEYWSYIKFNVDTIMKVKSATLYGYVGNAIANNVCYIYIVTSNWSASTVTWNTKPSNGASYGTFNATANGWQTSSDLSALINAWKSGTANYGILLKLTAGTPNNTYISSIEATNKPYLLVKYHINGVAIGSPMIF